MSGATHGFRRPRSICVRSQITRAIVTETSGSRPRRVGEGRKTTRYAASYAQTEIATRARPLLTEGAEAETQAREADVRRGPLRPRRVRQEALSLERQRGDLECRRVRAALPVTAPARVRALGPRWRRVLVFAPVVLALVLALAAVLLRRAP